MPSRGPERLQAVLGTLPMFRELPPPLRARVASMATMQDVAKGDAVWHAGDAPDSLTMVVEGRLKIVKHAEAGDVILEMFGPGEVAGVVALYNQIPYPATAIAMEPSVLLHLPRRDWFDLLERDPAFTRAVLLAMTRLNMALTRKLASMHGTRVQARVATLFLSLADRMGRETSGASIRWRSRARDRGDGGHYGRDGDPRDEPLEPRGRAAHRPRAVRTRSRSSE
jgi:CRP-like cAMP-binding protein